MEVLKTQKGALTIINGKSGMGKSTIAVYNAAEDLKNGRNVMFFSYEYYQSMIYNKLVSHFKVSWKDLTKLDVVSSDILDLKNISYIIRMRKDTVDVVYIDYLDLLRQITNPNTKDDEGVEAREQDEDIIAVLASIASELNIAIVLLVQDKADSTIEQTVDYLNALTSKVEVNQNVIKMFIGRDNIFNSMIHSDNVSHIVLVDGYNLQHFASINITEAYKD